MSKKEYVVNNIPGLFNAGKTYAHGVPIIADENLKRLRDIKQRIDGVVAVTKCAPPPVEESEEEAEAREKEEVDMDRARKVADDLLKGEGLNHSSWMRGMGLDKGKDRKKSKPVYDEIFNSFDGRINKQQNDWFFNDGVK